MAVRGEIRDNRAQQSAATTSGTYDWVCIRGVSESLRKSRATFISRVHYKRKKKKGLKSSA